MKRHCLYLLVGMLPVVLGGSGDSTTDPEDSTTGPEGDRTYMLEVRETIGVNGGTLEAPDFSLAIPLEHSTGITRLSFMPQPMISRSI